MPATHTLTRISPTTSSTKNNDNLFKDVEEINNCGSLPILVYAKVC